MTIKISATQSLKMFYCLEPWIKHHDRRIYFGMDCAVFPSVVELMQSANRLYACGEPELADVLLREAKYAG